MKTCKLSVLAVLLIACLLCIEADSAAVERPWALQGQGLDLINREDPRSPFFNPKASRDEILRAAIERSWSRLVTLNNQVALAIASPSQKERMYQAWSHMDGSKGPFGGVVSAPPTSNGAQEYFVSLKIGTPPKEVLLTIDTGSEITWTQCTPCVICYPQLLPIFNPVASKSYVGLNCQNPNCNSTTGALAVCSVGDNSCAYEAGYGDGSSTIGTLSTETFTFSSKKGRSVAVPNLIFGCGRLNKGLFTGNSGLLGLDRGKFSFATQLKDVSGHKFSYCYTDRLRSPNATSFLFFGDTDFKGLRYTPIQSVSGGADLYYVNFIGISVGNTTVNFDPAVLKLNANGTGGSIVDSGTYVTFLPDSVYQPLTSTFLKVSKLIVAPPSNATFGLDLCFIIPSYPPKVPTLTFHLENVDLVFGPDNIFIGPFDTHGELYCFAFLNSGSLGVAIPAIIGNVQQQDFRIEYDLEHSRIGFKKTDCAAS